MYKLMPVMLLMLTFFSALSAFGGDCPNLSGEYSNCRIRSNGNANWIAFPNDTHIFISPQNSGAEYTWLHLGDSRIETPYLPDGLVRSLPTGVDVRASCGQNSTGKETLSVEQIGNGIYDITYYFSKSQNSLVVEFSGIPGAQEECFKGVK